MTSPLGNRRTRGRQKADLRAATGLGTVLREQRLAVGATLQDVADATGKSVSYICDIESGRRGPNIEPMFAMLWAEYLDLDPADIFLFIGLSHEQVLRLRTQHYLTSGAWAKRWVGTKHRLEEALPVAQALFLQLRGDDKDRARVLRDAIRACLNMMHVPHQE